MENEVRDKLRVGVLLGGMSSEREISLESGRNIYTKLDPKKYEPHAIFMDGEARLWEIPVKLLMRNSTRDIEIDLEESSRRIFYEDLKEFVDLIYIGLHGKYGEDGCLQGMLEILSVPYVGSGVLASALGMNKYAARKVLAMNGIAVPETIAVTEHEWKADPGGVVTRITAEKGFPRVVKPAREGCSTAVKKVVDEEGLRGALDAALEWDSLALVEDFIDGREVTCGVLGNDDPVALTPSETIPTEDVLSLEDKFLYGQGENKTPPRLPEETIRAIQDVAVRSYRALGLAVYARIDMFVRNDGEIVVLEPNSLPGMTPSTVLFHQAAASGIDQTAFIDRVIQLSRDAHTAKRGPL